MFAAPQGTGGGPANRAGFHPHGRLRHRAVLLATAVSPLLFGLALQREVPMTLLASALSAYVVVVPWLAGRWLPRKP